MTTHARSLVVFNVVLAALAGAFVVVCGYIVLNMIALQVVARAVSQ